MPVEAEEDIEERSSKASLLKKAKGYWSQISFVSTVIGTLIGGYVWVDNKLDEYAQRGVDISDLKESNAALRSEQAAINSRITEGINDATNQIRDEFATRDTVDAELRTNILAVLNEMRARHGVVTLADQPENAGSTTMRRRVSVQEAQEAADRATIRSSNAMPQRDPLSDLSGL